MAKSVINVLQEHCIREHKQYPDYIVKDTSSGCSPQFTVECVIKGMRSIGIASSKIGAKTEAAEQMIKKLGLFNNNNNNSNYTLYDNRTYQSPERTIGNFIGNLNEYCSKHNYAYPTYTDEHDGLLFVSKCKHQSLVTVGKAGTKKAAKQESARQMMKLLNQNTIPYTSNKNTDNNIALISLTSDLRLEQFFKLESPSTNSPTSNTVKHEPVKFLPAQGLDPVSALNVYCDKYRYKKPEYYECGKQGEHYKVKCRHQSLVTMGSGLTQKFAKQDSAKQMLELIRVQSPTPKATAVRDLIDMTDNSAMVSPISTNAIKPIPDADLIQLYKDNSAKLEAAQDKTSTYESLLANMNEFHLNLEDDEGTSHPHLRKILNDSRVQFSIDLWQKHDPCIMGLAAKRLMQDGSVTEKTFLEMGDRKCDIVKTLLERTIDAFKC